MEETVRLKKAVSVEGFVAIAVFFALFGFLGTKMGAINLINTMINTAYDLLLHTVFYIMGVAVLTGALSGFFSEFGVISIVNLALSRLMKALYGLPGVASLGILTTYLSDNPAILALADNQGFRRYFRKYQIPALCNLGTAFGMGFMISTYIAGIRTPDGQSFLSSVVIGNMGAIIGSIVSTRLMLCYTARYYGREAACIVSGPEIDIIHHREIRQGGVGGRLMEAVLDGGQKGVRMGVAIIPGVLIICTMVLLFTNGPSAGGGYTGAAYEGIALLSTLGEKAGFLFKALFGFTHMEVIAVPVTALGAAGAAMGLLPNLVKQGLVSGGDIAVCTAMCMCWSGYLSTHIAMMDSLGCRELAGKSIFCHTIGGLVAGVAANLIYQLMLLF